jgi:hypothetical protein
MDATSPTDLEQRFIIMCVGIASLWYANKNTCMVQIQILLIFRNWEVCVIDLSDSLHHATRIGFSDFRFIVIGCGIRLTGQPCAG